MSLKPTVDFYIKTSFFKTSANVGSLLLIMLVGLVSMVAAQEVNPDDFPVPATYKTEGIPPIKKSEVENLFYDPSTIRSNLIWDTDKKNRRMLVTDETNNIYSLDAPSSQPVKLVEKIVPNTVKVRPGGDSFAFTDDHENEDNYQLYFYDFKQKTPKKIVGLAGKDESIDSFTWSKSGDVLFYMRVDYDSKTSKLCRYDFRQENCYPLELKGIWSVVQEEDGRLLIKDFKAPSDQHLYVYDLPANKLLAIDDKNNSPKGFLVNNIVYWISEGSNESCKKDPCILSQDLKTDKVLPLMLPASIKSLYDVKVSPEGNNVLVQETKDSIDHLQVFQLKKNKITKAFPEFISGSYVVWNTRWLSDDEVAYTLENIGKPASIQSFNFKTKKTTDWTKERLPAQLESKVTSPEVFKWKSFDGKEISGYVVRPATAVQGKKAPVLIFIHGGPPVLDRPVFSSQDIRLASNLGLTIIHTNIRGSNGFGKEFMDADNQEKRGDAVKDIRALLDWIERQPNLDANGIFIRGESYGGFVALSTALQEPLRIKGVIAEYPLVSIRGFLSQSWIDKAAKNEYGDPQDENLMKKFDELSPLGNAKRWNKIPLFMTRGKLDARVPEKDVTDLKTQLQTNGTDVWYIYSAEDGHGFGGRYVFAAMYEFLKKQINNK